MAKAKELTAKQEAACQAYIECGGNQSEAYRQAYDAENMKPETVWTEASLLFSDPNVAKRVLELQAIHAERHNVTIDTLTSDLFKARDLAETEKQPAAMTGAVMGVAKIHGLVTDKKELSGKDGAPIETVFNFVPVNSKTGE
jgi:hypothetical protein